MFGAQANGAIRITGNTGPRSAPSNAVGHCCPEGAVISVTITATVVAGYTGTLENIARVPIAAGAVLLAATRRRRV